MDFTASERMVLSEVCTSKYWGHLHKDGMSLTTAQALPNLGSWAPSFMSGLMSTMSDVEPVCPSHFLRSVLLVAPGPSSCWACFA